MSENRVKILYVEDDRVDQMAFQQFIKVQALPFDYKLAGSVSEAKKILDNENFEVVITDFNLGDGDAFDVFGSVKGETPIILVTAQNDLQLAVKAMKNGAYDYLVKDLNRDYLGFLEATVKKAVDYKKADVQLVIEKKQEEEIVKEKELFLINMNHEMRTPMNAIVGFSDLIEKTALSLEQKQYIDAIKTSGENLLVIINNILDFSNINSGKVAFEQLSFKLSQVSTSVFALMNEKAIEKGIKFTTLIDPSIPDNLIGDPARLNQILLNIIGNAIKFTEKGEIKTVVKSISEDDNFVELKFSITDTGIGIPEKKLNSIFEQFTKTAIDTNKLYGGIGLGLSIVKHLVEMQGGNVSVESQVGIGSDFSFTLKFKKNPQFIENKIEILDNETENLDLINGLRILVVEDNLMNQMLAKNVISNWNCTVEIANNGLEAIELLERNDFDFILMDIQLPKMDGYEATFHIRNKMLPPKSTIPIIALTANAILSEEQKCYQSGMNSYVTKPFDKTKLLSKIIAVLKASNFKFKKLESEANE